jgi:hypothetical protein
MRSVEHTGGPTNGADYRRLGWVLLVLLAAIGLFLSLGRPITPNAYISDGQFVTTSTDQADDCAGEHGSSPVHCHMTVACSASISADVDQLAFGNCVARHGTPMSQPIDLSRSLRPNLQPPKHSIQA